MFEIYSEVRAILSSNVTSAIEGCVADAIKECVFTATVEQIVPPDGDVEVDMPRFQLRGTLDGILIAKTKLEELLNHLHLKRLAKEAKELDSTTFSEENSSLADEGNTSYDVGTDKTSCVSDDKEDKVSSNGYVSTNTESGGVSAAHPMRLLRPLHNKRLRCNLKDRPRARAAQLRKKSTVRSKTRSGRAFLLWNDPDCLSENLQQMKLATEDSDFDSAGCEEKGEGGGPVRRPCKAKNCEVDPLSVYKHFCDHCPFKTKHSTHFYKHVKIHEKVLSCPHCSYQTTKQHYYDRHQRLHCSKRSFLHQCEQCSYKTHRKEHFVRHVNNVHGNLRPYLCHVCGKSFKRADALRQHHGTHADPASSENAAATFRCGVCEKAFRTQSHLAEHQAVHSEYRSFLCEVCGASFKTRSVHRKHVQSLHRNPRSHACDVCFKKFNTQYTLKRHKKGHKCGFLPPVPLVATTTEPTISTVAAAPLPVEGFQPIVPVTTTAGLVDVPAVRSSTPVVAGRELLQPPVFTAPGTATVLYLQTNMQHLGV